jgi:hypothetical protein
LLAATTQHSNPKELFMRHEPQSANRCPSLKLLGLFVGWLAATPVMAATCEANAGARPPAVVELYTSQGCSSCPPADRWLSGLKNQPGVIALGFHVNYWNHLGWTDPFATPQTTERQRLIKESIRGKYVYTPQVVLNGEDHREWRGQRADQLPALPTAEAPSLRLVREGRQVTAQIGPSHSASRWAGYWAVLQDDQRSAVTRGENAGETLRNDHVVRLYQPVTSWVANQASQHSLSLPPSVGQRVVFVVTQANGLRPVQGAVLSCAG